MVKNFFMLLRLILVDRVCAKFNYRARM